MKKVEVLLIFIFENDLSIKKTYISTEEDIITNKDTFKKMYFLFGTTNLTGTYKVKADDTIESIAYNNKLGVEDFFSSKSRYQR
ncbi:MAG: hypothetical protein L6V81_09945 [Clostridium sp.]|nr:MAG: hypothetical protein L6V81_09945 [Clostridium sp.]